MKILTSISLSTAPCSTKSKSANMWKDISQRWKKPMGSTASNAWTAIAFATQYFYASAHIHKYNCKTVAQGKLTD